MCGTRLKRYSLGLVLSVLLLQPLYSGDVYEITAEELDELETILSEQEATIEEQRETLMQLSLTIERQGETLTRLSTTIERQAETIETLGTSFNEYEKEVRLNAIRNTAIGVAAGIAVREVIRWIWQ